MAPSAGVPVVVVRPPAVGRRGRDRGTRAWSSPPEPSLRGSDAETSGLEEAASQHSVSSKSGDDDASSGFESEGDDAEESSGVESGDDDGCGSGLGTTSDNGADGDSALESSPLRKRTKRASRPIGQRGH